MSGNTWSLKTPCVVRSKLSEKNSLHPFLLIASSAFMMVFLSLQTTEKIIPAFSLPAKETTPEGETNLSYIKDDAIKREMTHFWLQLSPLTSIIEVSDVQLTVTELEKRHFPNSLEKPFTKFACLLQHFSPLSRILKPVYNTYGCIYKLLLLECWALGRSTQLSQSFRVVLLAYIPKNRSYDVSLSLTWLDAFASIYELCKETFSQRGFS